MPSLSSSSSAPFQERDDCSILTGRLFRPALREAVCLTDISPSQTPPRLLAHGNASGL